MTQVLDATTPAPPIGGTHPRISAWRKVADADDAVAECNTLAIVLDAAHDVLREMHYGLPDGRRNTALDQVSALVDVAQGMACYLAAAIDEFPRDRSPVQAEGAA